MMHAGGYCGYRSWGALWCELRAVCSVAVDAGGYCVCGYRSWGALWCELRAVCSVAVDAGGVLCLWVQKLGRPLV